MLLLAAFPAALAGDKGQVPFPTKKTTILRKEGTVYYVEGRQRIPKGCQISCQKDVKIVARGKNAVLEVEGELKIHGVQDREVIIEGIWVEPAERFGAIQLDMVIFRDGGGVRTPARKTSSGKLVVENTTFNGGATLNVAMSSGTLDIRSTAAYSQLTIRAVPEEGKKKSSLVLAIIGNYNQMGGDGGGFVGGLSVQGVHKPTVRATRIAGGRCEFVDCPGTTFDGNKVNSNLLSFQNTVPGLFKGTKLQKCDIYSPRVSFRAPKGGKETVVIDKCWFRGLTKKKDILERVIRDSGDDPENGVTVKFRKINTRPLELAGAIDR